MQLPPIPIDDLSDDILKLLASEETATAIDGLATRHGLGEDEVFRFSALVGRIAAGVVEMPYFPRALEEYIGLDAERARRVARDAARSVLWPMSWKLRGVDELIRSLGGEVPKEKPAPPAASAEEAATAAYPAPPPPSAREERAELLGGEASFGGASMPGGARAMPAAPLPRPAPPAGARPGSGTVARPGEVEKLLEKNTLPKPPVPRSDVEPKIRGNIVDLSTQ